MRRRLAGALWLAVLLLPLLSPGSARAAEYEMSTVTRYVVDPAAGKIAVTVEVKFTNTTPDPPGQVSAFDRVEMAIHDGASQVTAEDAMGSLGVDLGTRGGVRLASVKPRSRVGYQGVVSFTLSYLLLDGSAPGVHVRAHVVKLGVWGFGTSSQVTVELPGSYQARADGDPMVIAADGGVLRLTSGPIPNPAGWLALVTASRPSSYVTHEASVALASGTVDLQVRAWSDDASWGERTLALFVASLPMLEKATGLPYPRVGPLVVTEAVGGEGSTGDGASQSASIAEIQVAFDASPFALLHQAAHVWIGEHLAADRWIREGLASHYAARAAPGLQVALPYDPAARATQLAADARPLVGWGAGADGAAADTYAYAESWAFVDRIGTAVGEGQLGKALRRVTAGITAYDPIDPDLRAPSGLPFPPVDTRRFLDQLTAASGVDLAAMFGDVAFGPAADGELAQRAAARADLGRLTAAAGDWGAPDPIRAAMAGWRFDEARQGIVEAAAWLVQRDALLARIGTAGLTTPQRLRGRFTVGGGGQSARAELDAERVVVDAYVRLQERVMAPRGPLDTIGLLAADDPRQLLGEAAVSFSRGDLQAAVQALDRTALQLNRAPTNGAVRIASAAVLLAVIGLFVTRTKGRPPGTHYTAAP